MTDWPVKTLGEVVRFDSETARPEDLSSKDVYVGLENIASDGTLAGLGNVSAETLKSNKARFTDKHILFGKLRPYLVKVVRPDFSGVCSTDILPINPSAELSRDYLYWYMRSPAVIEAATEASTGTTLPRVSPTILKSFEIPVPPLDEQKRIVELLDAATERVTELTACYEQARTHANNLFTSALRDALNSHQSAPLRTLDDLCEAGIVKLGRGNIISKKDIAAKPGPYPIYSSARENEGKFGEYGDYMFDEEMITWSIDGGGRLFYRPKHKFSVTNVGGTLRVLDPQTLDIQYLHRVLQNLHSQRVFDWVAKAHPSVIRKVYDAIPMPPLSEQKRVVALLDSMRAKTSEMVTAYDAKLTTAKNLRQSILEAAFAGDL